jgi:hypothetical protein
VLVQAREDLIEKTVQVAHRREEGHHSSLQLHLAGAAPRRLRQVEG